MDPIQPFLVQGGLFGAGLTVGLAVASVVWVQFVRVLRARDVDRSEAAVRSEAITVALTSIDKTLGFMLQLVQNLKKGRG